MKRIALAPLLLSAAAAALASAAGSGALRERKAVSTAGLRAPVVGRIRDSVVEGAPRRLQSARDTVYYTQDGFPVNVSVSSGYQPDPAADQALVNFLGGLLHGPEMGKLNAVVLTPAELAQACGADALACYVPDLSALVVPGEDLGGVPLEQLIAHEYGHHVLHNRLNPPWDAGDWGSKRWASYNNICARQQAGEVFPGDEGDNYLLNPGEGWAETFRLYNANRAGTWGAIDWNSSPVFFPDANSFTLLQLDVTKPWTKPETLVRTGTLRKGQIRTFRLQTFDDGGMSATVKAPKGATIRFFTDGSSPQTLSPLSSRRTSFTVCGQEHVVLGIRGTRKGAFRLTIVRP